MIVELSSAIDLLLGIRMSQPVKAMSQRCLFRSAVRIMKVLVNYVVRNDTLIPYCRLVSFNMLSFGRHCTCRKLIR